MTTTQRNGRADGLLPPINLYNAQLLKRTRTVVGDAQCDQHLRDKNAKRGQEQSDARDRLVMRFLPFIWLEDQNLEPVTLMETVAERLWVAAQKERQRRKARQREYQE